MILKTPRCLYCGKTGELEVQSADLFAFMMGQSVQDAFPHLSVDEREQIITGTHVGECSHKFDEDAEAYETDWDNNGN